MRKTCQMLMHMLLYMQYFFVVSVESKMVSYRPFEVECHCMLIFIFFIIIFFLVTK